jgi:hypothetical protein
MSSGNPTPSLTEQPRRQKSLATLMKSCGEDGAAQCTRAPGVPKLMKRSRRHFLKTGTVAALVTTALPQVLEKIVVAHPAKRGADLFDIPLESQNDPLSRYGRSAFQSYVDSIFEVNLGSTWAPLTLNAVTDTGTAAPKPIKGKRERGVTTDVVQENRFSLQFRGPVEIWFGQNTYEVRHAALGTFRLFLVPVGFRDGHYYEAVVNRVQK